MAATFYKWILFCFLPLSFQEGDKTLLFPVNETVAFHPFYVSVTEVAHNSKDKALEVSCKIFADDLEEILKLNYKTPVDLTVQQRQAQNDRLINDYIQKHLLLVADGKSLKLSYVGFEKEAESVYCYFEVPNVAAVKKLDLTNSILQDLNTDQINIIHATVNGTRKSYKLDFPKKEVSFSF